MLILALDTSGDICSINLSDGPRELTTLNFRHDRRLSERLSPLLDVLLKDRGLTLRDIEGIAVGLGPGSFTGVRVGVTFAKTLAFALEKPVVGISSLDALIEPYTPFHAGILAAVTPTRRGESVVACYRPGSLTPVAPPVVVPNVEIPDHAARLIPDSLTITLIGENAQAVRDALPSPETILAYPTYPTAAAIARLAFPRLTLGETDDPDTLVPQYITPTPVG